MAPRYQVVDASVSLKWALNDEEAVAEAVALRDAAMAGRFEMVAPSLWLYEVANGLVAATTRRRMTMEAGLQALRHVLALGVVLADPDSDQVYEQACRYHLSAYDAAYLALAEALGAPFWTGDRRFYEAIRLSVDLARWIGDYDIQ